jgi:hypothetical protein
VVFLLFFRWHSFWYGRLLAVRSNFVSSLNSIYDCLLTSEHWTSLEKFPLHLLTYFKPNINFFLLLHQISWDSVMRMDVNLRDLFLYVAFLYYNPLLLVVSGGLILLFIFYYEHNFCENFAWWFLLLLLQTIMVWLWGVNLWVFLQSNVSYPKIFDLDQNHLTHREIWKVVNFFAFIYEKTLFNAKC